MSTKRIQIINGFPQANWEQTDKTKSDYIKNKPFEEETVEIGDTLTWDGTPTEIVAGKYPLFAFHVSDSMPTREELVDGELILSIYGLDMPEGALPGTYKITDSMLVSFGENVLSCIIESGLLAFAVCYADNTVVDADGVSYTLPKRGIYFGKKIGKDSEGGKLLVGHPTSLKLSDYTFTKTNFKPIDTKFLPEEGFGYKTYTSKDTLVWDGVVGNRHTFTVEEDFDGDGSTSTASYCHISDEVPPKEMTQRGAITDGETEVLLSGFDPVESDTGYEFSFFIKVFYNDGTVDGVEVKKGIYMFYNPDQLIPLSLTIPDYFNFESEPETHKINAEFLPEVSWNDLNDKPEGGFGYTETELVELIPETVCSADETDTSAFPIEGLSLVAGKTYEVTVDGVTSTVIAVDISSMIGEEGVAAGNMSIISSELEDSGEEFVLLYVPSDGFSALGHKTKVYPETITVGINLIEEKVHGVDPKFLPEGIGYEVKGGVSGDTITWDGKPTDVLAGAGAATDGSAEWGYYKISGKVPTLEQMKTGTISGIAADGREVSFLASGEDNEAVVTTDYDTFYTVVLEFFVVLVAKVDGAVWDEKIFPQKGIYFGFTKSSDSIIRIKSLTIPDFDFAETKVYKIDSKFLPETSWNDLQDKPFDEEIMEIGDTLTWDGVVGDRHAVLLELDVDGTGDVQTLTYYHISDNVPTKEQMAQASFTRDGETYDLSQVTPIEADDGSNYTLGFYVIVFNYDAITNGTAWKKGIYVSYKESTSNISLTIPNFEFTSTVVHQIDSKFIPELAKTNLSSDVQASLDKADTALQESNLSTAIDTALAQAKESGEFDGADGAKGDKGDTGEPGYTPVRGTDYWTDADKAEIKAYVDDAILNGAW